MNHRIIGLLLALVLLGSCTPYSEDIGYVSSNYRPVLMERSELETSVKLIDPQTITNFGKIYRYGDMLFINEQFEGIHIINNADPANPVNIGFITIPGNIDIAIKDDYIYADNAVDLIVISYDGLNVQVVDRNRDVFPEIPSPDGFYNSDLANRPENTVVIKWNEI